MSNDSQLELKSKIQQASELGKKIDNNINDALIDLIKSHLSPRSISFDDFITYGWNKNHIANRGTDGYIFSAKQAEDIEYVKLFHANNELHVWTLYENAGLIDIYQGFEDATLAHDVAGYIITDVPAPFANCGVIER